MKTASGAKARSQGLRRHPVLHLRKRKSAPGSAKPAEPPWPGSTELEVLELPEDGDEPAGFQDDLPEY